MTAGSRLLVRAYPAGRWALSSQGHSGALPMDRVTGGPIKAGAGLAAVVAEHVGWAAAGENGVRGQSGPQEGLQQMVPGC